MESFLKQKLQQDFLDCIAIDKSIVMGNLRTTEGTLILFDLLDHVKSDIATMDKETWELLNQAERKFMLDCAQRKYEIQKDRRIKDSSDKRSLELELLREDYKTCKELLYFIQNLCWKQGWFQ